jgi:anti-anti-sigma factor
MKSSFHDSLLHLEFDGDLLSTNVAALRAELLPLFEQHSAARGVVADLGRAQKVDSQGLNLLVALHRETERRGLSFRVENPTSDIRRLITLLNLGPRFGVQPASTP